MARQTKKKSLLDAPATAALMAELGMNKKPEAEAPPPKKKVVRRRGKPVKCPNIKSEVEKKRTVLSAVKKQWKVLYGTNSHAASKVPGWLRGYGVTIKGDPPELRDEMLTLSRLANYIVTNRGNDSE